MRHILRAPRLFRIAFVTAALVMCVALLAPSDRLPDEVELLSDKVWHVVAFAVFAMLSRLAFPRVAITHLALALVAFSGVMEVLQAAMGWGRRGEWIDLGANTLGVCIGLALGALMARNNALKG